jgi:hypothetical protein
MWNPPTEKQLAKLPKLYSTEDVALKDKKILMHFFIGACDWYAAEYSDGMFFGYSNMGDDQCAEWGNFSLAELKAVKIGYVEVDRDLFWKPIKASEVKRITNL